MRAMIAVFVVLLFSFEALAHRPKELADRVRVERPTISWVLAGAFETGLETFVVDLTFEEGIALPFEVMVPTRSKWALHRPWYAIVGPGLPAPTEEVEAVLPFQVPEGAGVFLERHDDLERDVYFEPVMRRTLWSSGTTAVPLSTGDYEVWIWSPNLTTGDFQFAFGVEEDFSDGGFGEIFSDWSLYAY